jgi:antiviral defense system Shedu protein SduA
LLARKYRQGAYPWSWEVGAAISQVLHYQNSLTRDIVRLRQGVDNHLESDAFRCLVIAGNVGEELNTNAKKRSFTRLRENLHGVSVIGFDELFGRAEKMLEILTRPEGTGAGG